jgi:hypothetical protein
VNPKPFPSPSDDGGTGAKDMFSRSHGSVPSFSSHDLHNLHPKVISASSLTHRQKSGSKIGEKKSGVDFDFDES